MSTASLFEAETIVSRKAAPDGAVPERPWRVRLEAATAALREAASAFDHDGADPVALCRPLVREGLFVDALAVEEGGRGWASDPSAWPQLNHVLQAIGAADLSAGRIYEGHVNAVGLVDRYGAAPRRAAYAADVRAGKVGGVWNAEVPPGLALVGDPASAARAHLVGGKIYASGLGLVELPIVTARTAEGEVLMLAPRVDETLGYDVSGWRMRGMRATATGVVALDGVRVGPAEVIGALGDYYRSPAFKGGAWRFAAVQTGAVVRLAQLMRAELAARGRAHDPDQLARIGTAAIAAQTARLWTASAARAVEDRSTPPADADAQAAMARLAVERAALEVIALLERGLGLSAFASDHAVEKIVRDLSTYLRQPFPDAVLREAAAHVVAMGTPAWETDGW